VKPIRDQAYAALNDDLNTAIAISHLFEAVRIVNSVHAGHEKLSASDIAHVQDTFRILVFDILGLQPEAVSGGGEDLEAVMQLLLSIRSDAKSKKDFATSDKIRDELGKVGFVIKDEKDGTTWKKA